jgi:hypothetical protein
MEIRVFKTRAKKINIITIILILVISIFKTLVKDIKIVNFTLKIILFIFYGSQILI